MIEEIEELIKDLCTPDAIDVLKAQYKPKWFSILEKRDSKNIIGHMMDSTSQIMKYNIQDIILEDYIENNKINKKAKKLTIYLTKKEA